MSTRCNIVVKKDDDTRYVYHHCDGYIAGVGKELKDFLKSIYKSNFFTVEELILQLALWDCSYESDDSGIHGDIEYLYTIELLCSNGNNLIKISAEYLDDWEKETWSEVKDYEEVFNIVKEYIEKDYDYELKIDPEYFEAVKDGSKTFEVRSTKDRTFKVGDVINLCEWKRSLSHIPGTLSIDEYPTGRKIKIRITYILNNPEYCKKDYCIFSFVKMII